jgi:hypothetical protein
MPSQNNFNSAGVSVTGNSVANTTVSSGITNQNKSQNNKFKARVTAVFSDSTILFENPYENFGRSDLGVPNSGNKARPIDIYNTAIPMIGEYVEIIPAPEAIGLSADKNSSNNIPYYGIVLNAWNNINGNKVLDQTVQGQVSNNQMTAINQNNINKSFILGGIV